MEILKKTYWQLKSQNGDWKDIILNYFTKSNFENASLQAI